MIQRLTGPLSILLLIALPAARGHAATARSVDLFAGLDAIKLSIEVGGPLDVQGGTERQLFAPDLRRFNRFEQDLTQALAAKVESCGILVYSPAPDELSVEVFGRREELQQCSPRYVYLIQARVLNSTRSTRQAAVEPVSLPPVIGLAEEEGLERTLIETAVALIAGELRNCNR